MAVHRPLLSGPLEEGSILPWWTAWRQATGLVSASGAAVWFDWLRMDCNSGLLSTAFSSQDAAPSATFTKRAVERRRGVECEYTTSVHCEEYAAQYDFSYEGSRSTKRHVAKRADTTLLRREGKVQQHVLRQRLNSSASFAKPFGAAAACG